MYDFALELIYYNAIAFLVGFVLDSVFREPPDIIHPVVWMGRLIAFLERYFYDFEDRFLSGIFFWFVCVIVAILPAILILFIFYLLRDYFFVRLMYSLVASYIFFSSISLGSLKLHALRVYDALKRGDLLSSREFLSLMVSRDTNGMAEEKIITSTIESVSENFVDGVLSPMFYYFLFGIVGAVFYKTVNTLDSMVGYKNDRYERFGKFSARVDDFVNFLPARLSIVFIAITSFLTGMGFESVIYTFGKYRKAHPSPNSAHPMSAFAGALKLRLGGKSRYFGVLVDKPSIGDFNRTAIAGDILIAIQLLERSSILAFLFFVFSYAMILIPNKW